MLSFKYSLETFALLELDDCERQETVLRNAAVSA